MAGRGDLGEVEAIENPLCYMFRMCKWQPMSEPINVDKGIRASFLPGISLAASFADSLSRHICAPVGLIPCAHGGTKISEWQEGEPLFENAIFTTKLAQKNSELCAIIWHQGESDCMPFDSEYYRKAFISCMSAFRNRLEMQDLPIIIGEISENTSESWGIREYAPKMNALMHTLSQELAHCAVANAAQLPLREDGIHFSPSAFI